MIRTPHHPTATPPTAATNQTSSHHRSTGDDTGSSSSSKQKHQGRIQRRRRQRQRARRSPFVVVAWRKFMSIIEHICIIADRTLIQLGIYKILLSGEKTTSNDEYNEQSGNNRRRRTTRMNDNDNKQWEVQKSKRIEYIVQQIQYQNSGASTMDAGTTPVDGLWEVRELALTRGGLLNDAYRQVLWPYLLGISPSSSLTSPLPSTKSRRTTDGTTSSSSSPSAFSSSLSPAVRSPLTMTKLSNDNTATGGPNRGDKDSGRSTARILNNILEVPSDEGGGPGEGGTGEDKNSSERHIDGCIDLIRRDAGRSVVFRYTVVVEDDLGGGAGGGTDSRTVSSIMSAAPSYATQRLARVLENVIRDGKKYDSSSTSAIPGGRWSTVDSGPLHYYQGLHDIAGVILHTLDYDVVLTRHILGQVCRTYLRDATRENFTKVTWMLNMFVPPLIRTVDPNLYEIVVEYAQVDLATVCLPWVITWFTHDLHDPDTASRLIDTFISSHPMLPMYMSVALITHPAFQDGITNADYNDAAAMFMLIKKMPLLLRHFGGRPRPDDNEFEEDGRGIVALQEVLEDALAIMYVPNVVCSEASSGNMLVQQKTVNSIFLTHGFSLLICFHHQLKWSDSRHLCIKHQVSVPTAIVNESCRSKDSFTTGT